jgi:methanogenic corrinoid protein MtbC1
VLTCAPGERHEIGLLMLAILLRADGWQVSYLGADTPVADAAALSTGLGASILCFSAGTRATVMRLRRELDGVRLPAALQVLVGGRGTRGLDAVSAVHALRTSAA